LIIINNLNIVDFGEKKYNNDIVEVNKSMKKSSKLASYINNINLEKLI